VLELAGLQFEDELKNTRVNLIACIIVHIRFDCALCGPRVLRLLNVLWPLYACIMPVCYYCFFLFRLLGFFLSFFCSLCSGLLSLLLPCCFFFGSFRRVGSLTLSALFISTKLLTLFLSAILGYFIFCYFFYIDRETFGFVLLLLFLLWFGLRLRLRFGSYSLGWDRRNTHFIDIFFLVNCYEL